MRTNATKEHNLALLHPELAKQWHPTKNGDLTPYGVSPGTVKKVWWLCGKGHEWDATPNSRTNGTGCPDCANEVRGTRLRQASVKQRGSLAETHPSIAREWHPSRNRQLSPSDVSSGSGTKVWWLCRRGHEWDAEVSGRVRGRGCPKCRPQTSKIEIRLFCELKAVFKDAKWREKIEGIECDIYLPRYKVAIELDGYWHHGREEVDRLKGKHLLEKGVEVFRLRHEKLGQVSQSDTPYGTNEKEISIIKRLLRNLIVHLSLTPEDKSKIVEYLESNQLRNNQEYRRIVAVLPGPLLEKSLAHLYPQLGKEWDHQKNGVLEPTMFLPGSGTKVSWLCEKGHEWNAEIKGRVRGRGCPECYPERLLKKRRSLAATHPSIAKEWHPTKNNQLTASDVMAGSGKMRWWLCEKGHEWPSTVLNRTNGQGCPDCWSIRRKRISSTATSHKLSEY